MMRILPPPLALVFRTQAKARDWWWNTRDHGKEVGRGYQEGRGRGNSRTHRALGRPNSPFPFQRLPRRQRRGRVWQNLSLLRDDMTHPWPDSRCLEVNYSRDFGIIRTKSQRREAMRIFCLIIDYSNQKKIRSLPPRLKVTSKIISCRDNTLIPWGSIIKALNYHAFVELKTGLRPRYALVTKTK